MNKNLQMSNSDLASAQLIYAKDCISSGRLLRAIKAIHAAIELIGKQDQYAVDDEVIRLLNGGAND
jgi:hypothetical protein